jgi:8-oxo-dGTP pyrophosphatase MutT (NUDIX family)
MLKTPTCVEAGYPMSDPQRLYTGRIITLDVEQVTLPNGVQTRFEIVGHPGGAAVVPVDDHGRVCLIRQYRHVARDWLWEIPAGKLDGRPAAVTARLELAEEAGLETGRLESLGTMWASPGIYTEVVHLFLARELASVPARPEDDEVLEVHWVTLSDAVRKALDGTYTDAKTVIGLLRAAHCLGLRP